MVSRGVFALPAVRSVVVSRHFVRDPLAAGGLRILGGVVRMG
jgi:hypothetical protein